MVALLRSHRALPLTIALTIVLALLPTGWLGWTAIPAEILSVPVQPMADAGVRLGWVVRSPEGVAGEGEVLRRRTAELETTRALLHQERLIVEQLQQEIEALQEARYMRPGVQMTPVYARVTGRAPDRTHGPVRLNAGSRHGVREGAIAVYRGGFLVGRAGDVSRLSSRLVPLTDRSTGLVEAVILPAGDPVASLDGRPRVQLEPDGRGQLVGDLDREITVHVGDVLRLADPGWPESALGLIVGEIASIVPKDLHPLLNCITVRPRYEAQRVATVTLLIERLTETAMGDGVGSGGGGGVGR